MSELLGCDRCGELSIYDSIIYIHDKPVCPACHSQAYDYLEAKSYKAIKKKYYFTKEKLTKKNE